MKYKFMYPRVLVDGVHRDKGSIHEISDKAAEHWFAKALIEKGDMIPVSSEAAAKAAKVDEKKGK